MMQWQEAKMREARALAYEAEKKAKYGRYIEKAMEMRMKAKRELATTKRLYELGLLD